MTVLGSVDLSTDCPIRKTFAVWIYMYLNYA